MAGSDLGKTHLRDLQKVNVLIKTREFSQQGSAHLSLGNDNNRKYK